MIFSFQAQVIDTLDLSISALTTVDPDEKGYFELFQDSITIECLSFQTLSIAKLPLF